MAVSDFDLFCAYHLGLTDEGGYRFQNLHDVAERFGVPQARLKQLLAEHGLDADAMIHSGFDVAAAQVEIMIAADAPTRLALARAHFEAYRAAPRRVRDWERELAEDARANRETYGED
jgi:hypothetical protein